MPTVTLPPGLLENQRIRRAGLQGSLVLLALLLGGTYGYCWLEGWRPLDALYMTVITLATIGYGETHALSDAGRIFTLALIVMGVGNLGYMLAEATAFMASGGLQAYRRRERMARMLTELKNHTIICGYGRLGTTITEELVKTSMPLVIIDRDPLIIERLQERGDVGVIRGDANDDQVLQAAGIGRAHALVAALNDDASNVFLTLTARVLTKEVNPTLVIHGKAEDPATLVKLKRAGADHTFSPALVLGHRIAHQILRPAVTELVGLSGSQGGVELSIEEVLAERLGDGKALRDTALWGKADLLILAVKTRDGEVIFPPRGELTIGTGDRVVVLARGGVLDTLVP